MGTVHLSYHFTSTAEGWQRAFGAATPTSNGWVSGGVDTGSFESTWSVQPGYQEYALLGAGGYGDATHTWESYGVPPGATITTVQLVTLSYRVQAVTPSAGTLYAGPFYFYRSGYVEMWGQAVSGPPITSDTGWITIGAQSPVAVYAGDSASSVGGVDFFFDFQLDDTAGTISIDAIEFDINYTGGAMPPSTDTLTVSVAETTLLNDTLSFSASDTLSVSVASVATRPLYSSDTLDIAIGERSAGGNPSGVATRFTSSYLPVG